jgi:uncharacterized protein YqhQ
VQDSSRVSFTKKIKALFTKMIGYVTIVSFGCILNIVQVVLPCFIGGVREYGRDCFLKWFLLENTLKNIFFFKFIFNISILKYSENTKKYINLKERKHIFF